MSSIYIHIPFCKQACHYCNFHFSTSRKLEKPLIEALLREVDLRIETAGSENEEIETIYFGGGTPSILEVPDIDRLLHKIIKNHSVATNAEITLEANPDDITALKAKGWKQAGINRLSIGIQSFHDRDLMWMNRAHGSIQALQCLDVARESGIHNLSIDLIFGVPGMSNEDWQKNIDTAKRLAIPHIAAYALTVEPRTALDKMIALGKKQGVDDDQQAGQFHMLMADLENAGYEHYEISNFALPGFRSRHNSSYWQYKNYIGIGPGAHSFNGQTRTWNIANNALYIKSIREGTIPLEAEHLNRQQQANELIMIALRTAEGLDFRALTARFGKGEAERILLAAKADLRDGNLILEEGKLVLTRKGKPLADGISVRLFS